MLTDVISSESDHGFISIGPWLPNRNKDREKQLSLFPPKPSN